MLLHLTDLSSEPLQQQIARQIRAQILAGELKAGDDLPSIRKLARTQHISIITVQRAYEGLEREGLIHSRRGKGFFVVELSGEAKKSMAGERLEEKLTPAVDAARSEGLSDPEIRRIVDRVLKKG